MKYDNRVRTRGVFTLTGEEHRGARAGNVRRVYYVAGGGGLLAVWGTERQDMTHITELESAIAARGFPLTVECDWIQPDPYEAEHFGHRYWVAQGDFLKIVKPATT
jgi:hypothetical protein